MTTNRKISIEGMSLLLETMKAAQTEHPKARVIYDVNAGDIVITYPLPKDFKDFTLEKDLGEEAYKEHQWS